MRREHIKIEADETLARGAPLVTCEGGSISSIVVRCHPDDFEVAKAIVRDAVVKAGGKNVRTETPS